MADGKESRFAHLLEPLRDLSQNWSVDLAGELSDYLAQLEEISFSFDGGATSLNFAEAALLIQGSTCVYSRKVEYLHKLVYNALQAVAQKRRAAAGGEEGEEAAEEAWEEEEGVEAFLALDDALVEGGAGIDLDEKAAARTAVAPKSPDLAFWALRERGGEAEGEYRIAACAVHSTGALLLDPGDAELLDEHLRYAVTPIPAPPPPDGEAAAAGEAPPAFAAGGGWSDDEGGYFPGGGGEEAEAAPPPAPPADEEEPDPWEPLDYNDAAGLPVRPYRRGRAGRREPPPAAGLGAPAARAQLAARAARRAGALGPEFLYAHAARARARAAAARAAARLARAGAAPAGAAPAGAADWLDYGGGGGGEDDDGGGGFGDGAGWEDDGEAAPMDGEALEAAAAAGLRAPAPRARAAEAEEEPPSYEEQVRAHVEACLAAAADAEATSELQQRVAGWRARIEPALAEQEARPAFDIHAVGAAVVGKLEAEAEAAAAVAGGAPEALCVPFARLMEGDPSFAVARAFSAMLQLVNSGNVGVVEAGGGGGGGGGFGLSLLHAGSAHSALDAYRAPSLLPQAEAAPAAKPGKKGGKGNPRTALGAAAAESA